MANILNSHIFDIIADKLTELRTKSSQLPINDAVRRYDRIWYQEDVNSFVHVSLPYTALVDYLHYKIVTEPYYIAYPIEINTAIREVWHHLPEPIRILVMAEILGG